MKRKLARQRGLPPPEEEPEVETADFVAEHLHWIWSAFASLSRTRLVNEAGPQPITILEIDAYCTFEGIWTEDERRTLLHHLTLLDIEYLKVTHENIRTAREKAKEQAERDAKNKAKGRR